MIFTSSFVELLVVNAHLPTGDSALRNEFIFLIVDNSHSILLRHHLYWTDLKVGGSCSTRPPGHVAWTTGHLAPNQLL
jgi:hypothetical protein